jgi:hypothetical protein
MLHLKVAMVHRSRLLSAYATVLLFIFGLVAFHAPLSVWISSSFPNLELIAKSWKEVVLIATLPVGLWIAVQTGLAKKLFRDNLFIAIALYGALHILLGVVLAKELLPLIAGLMIDLRFILFFVLVYMCVALQPSYRRRFLIVGAASALMVTTFALLQVFVLPKDILAAIGYSKQTIAPYLTVDNNPAIIRINSTLRGPNPLGAYAGMVLTLVTSFALLHWSPRLRPWQWQWVTLKFLGIGAAVAIWASYSRSALVATIVGVALVLLVILARKISIKVWGALSLTGFLLLAGIFTIFRDTSIVQQVIFHDDPVTQSPVNSNEQHVESLQVGMSRMITQPLGVGPGSTGSASLYGSTPFIIENQYLFIAHEAGWLGLGLFSFIFISILQRLWNCRRDWLALGLFASGLGLAAIGLLLPVWVDDTLSFVWWGLAAVALAAPHSGILRHYGKHSAKQKTT